jgi:hypothetical protein
MLLKHIKALNDWRVVSKVLWFWQLKHHLLDLRLWVAHLKAESQGVSQAQSTSKGRLELAHLEYFASNLRILSTTEPHRGGRDSHRPQRQWQGMDLF